MSLYLILKVANIHVKQKYMLPATIRTCTLQPNTVLKAENCKLDTLYVYLTSYTASCNSKIITFLPRAQLDKNYFVW